MDTGRAGRLPPAVRRALLDAWAVLSPVECAGCGEPDRAVCRSCRAAVLPEISERRLLDGTPVLSAQEYSGVLRALVLEFKERNRTDVARVLAVPLAAALERARALPGGAEAELAPVPTSFAAFRRRGYDPVRLMLRRARLPASRVLRRARGGPAQKTLGTEERRRNAAGTMRARRSLTGRTFLLVDDVLTTGATLEECARALREAGGTVVGAVTVASTRLATKRPNSLPKPPGTSPVEATRFIARR